MSCGREETGRAREIDVRLSYAAALLATALMAAGCSLNYEGAQVEADANPALPDTVAVGIVYRMVKKSRPVMELKADRAETFNTRNQTVLTEARFKEFDAEGKTATDGKADSVVYHTDTQNAEISGSVHVYSAAEQGSISTDYLKWENKTRVLTANPDDLVVVRKDDGSYISGRGFVGDFRIKEVRFNGPVEGQYVYEEEKKD
jgi:LPS export ABC transporter protein LptC